MEGEVMEGFICPLCYQDLKTLSNLNSHFQKHSLDEQKNANSLRGLYDKALKKIKKSEPTQELLEAEQPLTSKRIPGYAASAAEDPSSLPFRSHIDRFRSLRDARNERYAAQTNTLLIRLGKLLNHLPNDPVRRKAHEQEIVPWLDDKDVSLCPGCAKPFHLLKRKHHCRLCGSVMCHHCTFLLSLDDARKMAGISPPPSAPASPLNKMQQQAVQAVLSLDGLTLSDFRICEHCNRLLAAREMSRLNRSERPIIAQFYERMRTALDACDAAVMSYHKIHSSLCNGETLHTLEEAKSLRIEVIRLADTVDGTSKKIAALGTNSDPPPSAISLKLQSSVRNAATQYLKKKIITLPSLPTEEEILEFQEKRRIDMELRIEAERRKELEEEERRMRLETREQFQLLNASRGISSPRVQQAKAPKVQVGQNQNEKNALEPMEGWTPEVKRHIITDDPLLQQIGILHGFIEQARRAGKYEECEVLERNLRELEEALDQREAVTKSN